MKTLKKMDVEVKSLRVIDGTQLVNLIEVCAKHCNDGDVVAGITVIDGVTRVIPDAKLHCTDGLRYTTTTKKVTASFVLSYKECGKDVHDVFKLEMELEDVIETTKVVIMHH